jgi:hypothetical protein
MYCQRWHNCRARAGTQNRSRENNRFFRTTGPPMRYYEDEIMRCWCRTNRWRDVSCFRLLTISTGASTRRKHDRVESTHTVSYTRVIIRTVTTAPRARSRLTFLASATRVHNMVVYVNFALCISRRPAERVTCFCSHCV